MKANFSIFPYFSVFSVFYFIDIQSSVILFYGIQVYWNTEFYNIEAKMLT